MLPAAGPSADENEDDERRRLVIAVIADESDDDERRRLVHAVIAGFLGAAVIAAGVVN